MNQPNAPTVIDDGRTASDAPIRDALLRLGLLTPEESANEKRRAG